MAREALRWASETAGHVAEVLVRTHSNVSSGTADDAALLFWTVGAAAALQSAKSNVGKDAGGELRLPERYDPEASAAYFARKPVLVLTRALMLGVEAAGFLLQLWVDENVARDQSETTERLRAKQCRELAVRCGPTYVKVCQALSIRSDLLRPAYLEAFAGLQDDCPPFPTPLARAIMDKELQEAGQGTLEQVFRTISEEPIAAASLGQVYKATLKDSGKTVAVKVQRPDVLESICLDLHLLRMILPIWREKRRINTDLVGLVDEWALRFVDELNYSKEAKNATAFSAAIKQRELNAVTVAEVVEPYSTKKMLTTEWIDGKRLDRSTEPDVPKLCGAALNCYLLMLLDTGVLHSDPHPGNLMRTSDGRLCILDWGLVTEVTEEQQYAIINYIVHLVSGNYESVPRDLVKLGFIPEGKEKQTEDEGVVGTLSNVFRQLAAGGGAKKLNVEQVASEMRGLVDSYGNIFRIPSYFAYILRTFTILEGIGLQRDPDYTIVQECYPYLARRLFTDDDPRAKAALQEMLYQNGRFNAKRLRRLAGEFQSFTETTMSGEELARANRKEILLSPATKELLSILLDTKGNFLQETLLDELVAVMDAFGKESVLRVGRSPAGQLAAGMLQRFEVTGPLQPLFAPILLPGQVAASFVKFDERDEAALETGQAMYELLEPTLLKALETNDVQSLSIDRLERFVESVPELSEYVPGLNAIVLRFNQKLFSKLWQRATGSMAELQKYGTPAK
eukprot:scaffold1019_cov338-Pavlova_lutheri.AAC.7